VPRFKRFTDHVRAAAGIRRWIWERSWFGTSKGPWHDGPRDSLIAAIDRSENLALPLTEIGLRDTPTCWMRSAKTVLFAVLNPSCESQVHDDGF
jgi:hypothetical protein